MSDAPTLEPMTVPKPVPVVLSFVAGYVDSCTYLALFGIFVAQVTGSFVLAGTQLFRHEQGALAKLLAIPFFYLAGFAVTLLVRLLTSRPYAALALSLAIEALLLIGVLSTGLAAAPFADPDAPPAVVTLLFGMAAMGVQSAMVRLLLRATPSTNVMTTNTTQLAIDTAEALLGIIARRRASSIISDARATQARRGVAAFLPIALGFLAGTITGAAAYTEFGLSCVLGAIVLLAALTAWATQGR